MPFYLQILTYKSLSEGKNVLVGGALRDAFWYQEYFGHLRRVFPVLKIAILHVRTTVDTALRRAARRAKVTGRIVPDSVQIKNIWIY